MTRRGVRLIMRSLRAHPGLHALAMLGATGFVIATVGSAWALGWITDRVVVEASAGRPDRSDLITAAAVLTAIAVGGGVCVVVRRLFLVMATLRTQRDWRRQLLHRYVDLPLRFHMRRPAGELLAHADADLEAATMVLQPLAFALSVVILVVAAIVTLLTVHPMLALIAAVLFPVLAVMSRVYTLMVEEPSAEVQRRVGDVSSVAHESFDGALIVKTLGREPMEVRRMRAASARLRDERLLVGRLRGTFEPILEMLPTVGTIALMLVGSWLVGRDAVSPGDLVLAVALFSLLTMPLGIVGFFFEEIPKSVVALERVDGVLDLPVERSTGGEKLPPEPLSLEVDGLVVSLGGRRVLDGVSLAVAPGETVALVGSTGSGKSTLLEAVAGLIDVADGSIDLSGVPVERVDRIDLRSAVAMVFQEAFLFADSIAENVALQHGRGGEDAAAEDAGDAGRAGDGHCPGRGAGGGDERGDGHSERSEAESDAVRAALATAAAESFVYALPDGVETVVGERGVTLSGGQRQRIALARALIRAPRLLMLDDATSAVDPLVEREILSNLRESLSATTIVVAHRIATIQLADRVAYLADGRIVATGSHAELMARDDYRSLMTAYEREPSDGAGTA